MKIPGFEEISVNIFLMGKYGQKNIFDPDIFMCKYWKLSNETAAKCGQISNFLVFYSKIPKNGNFG